jgi:hypothetical protein
MIFEETIRSTGVFLVQMENILNILEKVSIQVHVLCIFLYNCVL